jgi:hypothetical protein
MQLGGPEFKALLDRLLAEASHLAPRIMPRCVIRKSLARRLPDTLVIKALLRSSTENNSGCVNHLSATGQNEIGH